jgi:hypothetical protein
MIEANRVCLSASSTCLKSRPWQTIANTALALRFSRIKAFNNPPLPPSYRNLRDNYNICYVPRLGVPHSSADGPRTPALRSGPNCLKASRGDMTRDIANPASSLGPTPRRWENAATQAIGVAPLLPRADANACLRAGNWIVWAVADDFLTTYGKWQGREQSSCTFLHTYIHTYS